MRGLLGRCILPLLLLSPGFGFAQWGDKYHQEKGDVLGRDLAAPFEWVEEHDGIFWQYTTGNPDDGNNSILIEMLKDPVATSPVCLSTGIGTCSVQSLINASNFRGAFRYKPRVLTREERALVVDTIEDMKNRADPIEYVPFPWFNQYLEWTDLNGNHFLDLDEIEKMRSDAVVEFPYAFRGFPLVRSGFGQSLREAPDFFIYWASLGSVIYGTGLLTPTLQLSRMSIATVEKPVLTVYNANGTPLASGAASSMTAITALVSDELSGPGRLEIWLGEAQTGTLVAVNDVDFNATEHLYTSADTGLSTMSNLANGQYTIRAIDQAANYSSGAFTIDTTALSAPVIRNVGGVTMGGTVVSTNNIVIESSKTASGICPLNISGPDSFSSSSPATGAEVKKFGPFALVKQGTYTATAQGCAGSVASTSFFFSTATVNTLRICAIHPVHGTSCGTPGPPHGDPDAATILDSVARIVSDSADPCVYDLRVEGQQITCLGGGSYTSTFTSDLSRSRYFSVTNISTFSTVNGITITAGVRANFGSQNDYPVVSGFGGGLGAGSVITGTVTIAEVGQNFSVAATSVTFVSKLKDLAISITSWTAAHLEQAYRQGLFPLGGLRNVLSSDFSLTSQGTMTFTNADPGSLPAVSTATLKFYAWTGSSWTLSGLSQIGNSTSGGLITSSATLSQSGFYSMLFSATDASAPTTSLTIQGSSYAFAGTSFVSTYSYVVLSSTDPTVDGFSSGLATTYYRIDGLPGDAYTAYSSSLSFLPGTHWVDYYAVDWAGNAGAVQRATITVTAGYVTRLSSDLQVDGNLLVGFLGSGAKAEVVARAEYDYALMVSSVDGRAMLAVDNANFASIGTAPASGRLTLAGVSQDTALALRSGNSTAAVTGAQIAFGYDGSGDLRHRLYTQHGSAANWNKMVFTLWTPASGSSSTLGNLPVLSLEGSTITAANALAHIMPAGIADKELVVSNGSAMGEGDVLRWDRWVPSAAILKKDIERLGRVDEEKAWADIASLRPLFFRRKTAPPSSPLERGYIYEETPLSIRDGPGAASVDERLVNVELALKAAIRRIEELKTRINKLKEARP